MAKQMREAGDNADLTSAVSILARPKMYKTVLAAVRERVNEAIPFSLEWTARTLSEEAALQEFVVWINVGA
jgi:hypothetical protein